MKDVVLVTADSVRHDYVDSMEFISSLTVNQGIAAGHYTRPSLAALHSSSIKAAAESRVVNPSIAERLHENGYTCIGLPLTPQADSTFGFDDGFTYYETHDAARTRGSRFRELLSQSSLVRRVYHRIFPPHVKMDRLPPDDEPIKQAIRRFNDADPPRFLWVHLMETHRPYGRGDDRVPRSLDRQALFAPSTVSAEQRETIESSYCRALRAADERIERLYRELGTDDPVFIFTSDHGDEFGEHGYYFHQPQRRRVADALIRVPVATSGIDLKEGLVSLIDLGPTICGAVDIESPTSWDGVDRRREQRTSAITVAPWNDRTTMGYVEPNRKLVCSDGSFSMTSSGEEVEINRSEPPEDVSERLRDLGYRK